MALSSNMSGSAYVSVRLKTDDVETQKTLGKVPTSVPRRCDHTGTICGTRSCIESWAIDYYLYLGRTEGGRRIFKEAFPERDDYLVPQEGDN